MPDTPLTRACIIGLAVGVLGYFFLAQHGGTNLAPADSPATPPPIVVRTNSSLSAGGGFSGGSGSISQAGSNKRALPALYASAALHVAVPDGNGGMRYLPGNDPAAIKYLDDQRTRENSLDFDNAPQNADTANLPPPSAVSPRVKRMPVKSS